MNKLRILALFTVFLAGCSKPSEQIMVATAANVQYVMKEIQQEFEKESGKKIEIVVASSGKLTTQIREGAPFDVFVSADTKYPRKSSKTAAPTGSRKFTQRAHWYYGPKTFPKLILTRKY